MFVCIKSLSTGALEKFYNNIIMIILSRLVSSIIQTMESILKNKLWNNITFQIFDKHKRENIMNCICKQNKKNTFEFCTVYGPPFNIY